MTNYKTNIAMLLASLSIISSAYSEDGWNPYTSATNKDSVKNTRHNLSMSYTAAQGNMAGALNLYGEVCVYCHTPHGASGTVKAPLWNRTKPASTFTVYNMPTTLGSPVTTPGDASLACLSCHDGVTAIDSVINMPGSGKYSQAQETAVSNAFLDKWSTFPAHYSLSSCTSACHNGTWAPAIKHPFAAFITGTDLSNDHPVGILYPTTFGPDVDFAPPSASNGKLSFFDNNGNGRADSNEIRMYNSGDGYEVECASCHDPHGVSSAGPGSTFSPSFLRVSNAGSVVCLTCHTK